MAKAISAAAATDFIQDIFIAFIVPSVHAQISSGADFKLKSRETRVRRVFERSQRPPTKVPEVSTSFRSNSIQKDVPTPRSPIPDTMHATCHLPRKCILFVMCELRMGGLTPLLEYHLCAAIYRSIRDRLSSFRALRAPASL